MANNNNNEMPKNNNKMPNNIKNKMPKNNNEKNNKPKNTLTPGRFIDLFFKKNHHNFYILKTEVDIKELIKQLNILIKRFSESLNIPLRIDPRILELCESGKDSEEKSDKYLKKYFTTGKKQFRELYNRTNRLLTSKNGINMRKLLRISNKSNHKINEYLKTTNSKLKKKLISEIRLMKFAIECGFETWEQLKNMFRLFKFIYKNKLEKYFDFDSPINNNSRFTFPRNSELLNGINIYKGAQIRDYRDKIRSVLEYHNPNYSSNNEIHVSNNNNLNNIYKHPRIKAIEHYLDESNNNN